MTEDNTVPIVEEVIVEQPEEKKKKVMLLNWPLLDVGGITTWSHQIVKGFEQIGWEADHYYCNRTGRFKCSINNFVPIGGKFKRGEKIPSLSLGFHGAYNENYFKDLLNNYEYVIFVHPSPHPTKANRTTAGMDSWIRLYEICNEMNKKVVVIFHDKKWHKTNKWFTDACPFIDVILAAQHNFIDSVNHYVDASGGSDLNIKTDWLYFPLDLTDCKEEDITEAERNKEFCMMPQWIRWKNHHKIIEVAEQIKYPIQFYNAGMEYHKLAKKDKWKDIIHFDHVENIAHCIDSLHEYHGFVTYEEVKRVYRHSMASIDLTTRTYQNYTHHEGMLRGCILCCTEECREGPYNHIPDGQYWPIDMSDIPGSLNSFMDLSEDSRQEIRLSAYNHVKENFDCRKVVEKINSIVYSL